MPALGKTRITVDEDPVIVAKLDEMAAAEGLSRNDIARRAFRRLLFSMPSGSINGTIPPKEHLPPLHTDAALDAIRDERIGDIVLSDEERAEVEAARSVVL